MKNEGNERKKGNKYIDFLKIQNVSKTDITNKEICRINNLGKKRKFLQKRRKVSIIIKEARIKKRKQFVRFERVISVFFRRGGGIGTFLKPHLYSPVSWRRWVQ